MAMSGIHTLMKGKRKCITMVGECLFAASQRAGRMVVCILAAYRYIHGLEIS